MSELDRIANILRETIKSRQVLAIGEAQFAAVQGQSALFTTASGTISAIATNFCYGKCLLAKVEGVWYALNPADGGVEIRSSVDRQIWRRPKTGEEKNKRIYFAFKSICQNPGLNFPVIYDVLFSDTYKSDLKISLPPYLSSEGDEPSYPEFVGDIGLRYPNSPLFRTEFLNLYKEDDFVLAWNAFNNNYYGQQVKQTYYSKSLIIDTAAALNKRYAIFFGRQAETLGSTFTSVVLRQYPVDLLLAVPQALSDEVAANITPTSTVFGQFRLGYFKNSFSEVEVESIIEEIAATPIFLSESQDGDGFATLAFYDPSTGDYLDRYPPDTIAKYYLHDSNIVIADLYLTPGLDPLNWLLSSNRRIIRFYDVVQYDTVTNTIQPLPVNIISSSSSFVYSDAPYLAP